MNNEPIWQHSSAKIRQQKCMHQLAYKAGVLNRQPAGQIRPANQCSLALWSPQEYIEIKEKLRKWYSFGPRACIFKLPLALHGIKRIPSIVRILYNTHYNLGKKCFGTSKIFRSFSPFCRSCFHMGKKKSTISLQIPWFLSEYLNFLGR